MPQPPYPLVPQPEQRSWLERNPNWKIPLGCLTLIFLLVGFGAGVLSLVEFSFHSSEAFQQAVARAQANPQVRALLGEPIRAQWTVSGDLHVNGSSGRADLSIPISGPNGKGTIRAIAIKNAGVWTFTFLRVTVGGRCVDLLPGQPAEAEREF